MTATQTGCFADRTFVGLIMLHAVDCIWKNNMKCEYLCVDEKAYSYNLQ